MVLHSKVICVIWLSLEILKHISLAPGDEVGIRTVALSLSHGGPRQFS